MTDCHIPGCPNMEGGAESINLPWEVMYPLPVCTQLTRASCSRREQGPEEQCPRGTLPLSSWLKDTARCHLDLEATQEITNIVMGGILASGSQLSHLRGPKKRNGWNKTLELRAPGR